MNMKRCPCGEVPTEFSVSETNDWRILSATGKCCLRWDFIFTTEIDITDMSHEEQQQAAARAWNELPRAEK